MRRKIAIALSALLMCSTLCGCKGGEESSSSLKGKMDITGIEIPTFEETKGVTIAAYAGPTVENWSMSSRNINTLTDEHFKKLQEAGFNTLVALHEGAPGGLPQGSNKFEKIEIQSARAEEHAMRALTLAEKYDIKYYVRDWPFYDLANEKDYNISIEEYEQVLRKMFDDDNPYILSSAYAGNFGRDEPGIDQYDELAAQIKIYNQIMDEKGIDGEFLLNMLPVYGSLEAFGGPNGKPATYQEYLDRYFEELAPLLGYFSYDFYPFKQDKIKGSAMRTTLVSNLEMLASRCKEGGYELRCFIQSQGDYTGLRDLTSVGDFRFQIYTNLAFGAKSLTYYEYGTFKSVDEGEFGLLNLKDGTYSYTYDLVKQVNHEVLAFEDAYLNYNYDGIMCFSSLPAGTINANFRSVNNIMKTHPRIGNVKVTEDAIMSAFKDAEGNDAFMLVNYTDPYFDKDNTVTVEFKDARALLMYRFGKQEVVPLNTDGTYTFQLYPGEGRFIIPLK